MDIYFITHLSNSRVIIGPEKIMDEPVWKKLKLSLERPYKDDNGDPIPILEDIAPDGKHIFEP